MTSKLGIRNGTRKLNRYRLRLRFTSFPYRSKQIAKTASAAVFAIKN